MRGLQDFPRTRITAPGLDRRGPASRPAARLPCYRPSVRLTVPPPSGGEGGGVTRTTDPPVDGAGRGGGGDSLRIPAGAEPAAMAADMCHLEVVGKRHAVEEL